VASSKSETAKGRAASERPTNLSDEQLDQMMKLMKSSDSVELKVSLAGDDLQAARKNLAFDPIEAQPRQVYFFDTPDLDLNKAGIVVRARRIQGGRGDTVVKLRPVTPDDLSAELRADPRFNVEVDAMPGGFVCSGSFKGRTTALEIRDALAGKFPVRKLFSKGQRKFFADHVPAEIDLAKLVVLGPTFVLKATFNAPELDDRRLVAEMWLYQDGSQIVELSTKCLPGEAFQVATETRLYLKKAGLALTGSQATKTKTALEFFQKQLGVGAA
jgi:hypothetical protein